MILSSCALAEGDGCGARTSGQGRCSVTLISKRGWQGSSAQTIRGVVNEALASLSSEFSALYALMGRPSIPPEKLLRAMLLQAFYTIRSERQLMEAAGVRSPVSLVRRHGR